MKRTVLAGMIALATGGAVAGLVETTAGKYPYAPVALNDVKVTGGFWLPRIETNRLVTVRTDFAKCEETGRIANFEKAGKREKGGFKGVPWDDSDVYKVIEIGLCRLYQATGDKKYLELAQHFIDMRGRKDLRPTWGAAYQDHVPVLMQKEALGHAVRAAYLYSGMADVAAHQGE